MAQRHGIGANRGWQCPLPEHSHIVEDRAPQQFEPKFSLKNEGLSQFLWGQFDAKRLGAGNIFSRFPKLAPRLLNPKCMLDRVAGQLERYMDLLSARQKLVASNVANVDTPGYITKDLDFQGEFQSAASFAQNAAGFAPNVVEVSGLQVKNDGNNVSLDRESRLLAENALRFQLASSLMKTQIQLVKSAITGGGQGA